MFSLIQRGSFFSLNVQVAARPIEDEVNFMEALAEHLKLESPESGDDMGSRSSG